MQGETLTPESGASTTPEESQVGEYKVPQGYDHLHDPDWEAPEPADPQRPAEEAAVRPGTPGALPALAEEARAEVDAALRERTPQEPLSAAEIAQKRGGEWPSQEDVDGINKAREAGIHLG